MHRDEQVCRLAWKGFGKRGLQRIVDAPSSKLLVSGAIVRDGRF